MKNMKTTWKDFIDSQHLSMKVIIYVFFLKIHILFSQEQTCSSQDILDENGIIRVSITVAALVAVSTNPKSSAV